MTAEPVPTGPPTPPHRSSPLLRLGSPSEVIAAVPGLLGFVPRDSLVVIALTDRRVTVTLRIDLLDPGQDDPAWRSMIVDRVRRAAPRAGEVLVITFDSTTVTHRSDLPHTGLMRLLIDDLLRSGLRVRDALGVDGRRWFSYLCDDDTCCPADGSPLDDDAALLAALGMDLAGVTVAQDRADLERELARDDGLGARLVEAALEGLHEHLLASLDRSGGMVRGREDTGAVPDHLHVAVEEWRDEQIDSLAGLLAGGGPNASEQAAILLALGDIKVRDCVLWGLLQVDDPQGWRRGCAVLTPCVRHAPDGTVAPTATLLAILHWLLGDGARARCAIDRALADDPAYSLGLLVHQSLEYGLPPDQWRDAMSGVSWEECRFGRPRDPGPGARTGRRARRRRGRD